MPSVNEILRKVIEDRKKEEQVLEKIHNKIESGKKLTKKEREYLDKEEKEKAEEETSYEEDYDYDY